ncbi:MAG: hypothetical protein DBW93_00515 [SAR86 cluster bacterium]|nr:MAG: hypothetical protein DBW93_00515 [SAR86 cluster bacterium]|tara:strand:+ start:1135 stop:1551 length:417 start_codon:yes stop_codon:yes gene_type:complete
MKFKYSKNKKKLFSVTGLSLLFLIFIFLENILINNLFEIRAEYDQKNQVFNDQKQKISQLKMYENNKNTENLVENLELFLKNKKISYSIDGALFLFNNLAPDKLIEILNYIQLNNIEPNEIKISGNESTLKLTIEVTA